MKWAEPDEILPSAFERNGLADQLDDVGRRQDQRLAVRYGTRAERRGCFGAAGGSVSSVHAKCNSVRVRPAQRGSGSYRVRAEQTMPRLWRKTNGFEPRGLAPRRPGAITFEKTRTTALTWRDRERNIAAP